MSLNDDGKISQCYLTVCARCKHHHRFANTIQVRCFISYLLYVQWRMVLLCYFRTVYSRLLKNQGLSRKVAEFLLNISYPLEISTPYRNPRWHTVKKTLYLENPCERRNTIAVLLLSMKKYIFKHLSLILISHYSWERADDSIQV